MPNSRPRWANREKIAVWLLLCASLVAFGAAGTNASARPSHRSHRGGQHAGALSAASPEPPRPLMAAAGRARRADRALVASARALKRCLGAHPRRPSRCTGSRRALQQAGGRFAGAERRLARLGRAGKRGSRRGSGAAASRANPRLAPRLLASGQALQWSRVDRITTYVVVRKLRGQPDQYSVVSGTSATPPPVPGATVRYSVRTTTRGSAWAPEVGISYAAAPRQAKLHNKQTAPVITVSGQTLSWNSLAGVSTYVLVRKAAGRADEYTQVGGTSVTPQAAPGITVDYSVRSAVEGSAWAPEVSITYPAASASPPPPVTTTTPPPATQPAPSGAFELGAVAGAATTELPYVQQLGARTVRMEFAINTPASQMAPIVEAYAHAGVRLLLLAGFSGRLPTAAEAQSLASWAGTFGPGGSAWQAKSFPAASAVTDIEFGNETSYTYQFSDNSPGAYASRAQTYALRFKEAQVAIQAANPNVGLLAQADSGGGGSQWVDNLFAAVPDLAQRVAGWTVHPYGSNWQARLDQLVNTTGSHGAPSSVPIFITEWGLATDNGRCLSDNYGWSKCMSYAEAAGTLASVLTAMRTRYGSRLAALYLYHVHDQAVTGASSDRESYFGALQLGGAPKGPYTSEIQSLIAANP